MEIIVPIRQVPDVALNIRVNEGKVVEDGVSFVISSWDETAIEGALQMTEELGGEVTLSESDLNVFLRHFGKGWPWEHIRRSMCFMRKVKPIPLDMPRSWPR